MSPATRRHRWLPFSLILLVTAAVAALASYELTARMGDTGKSPTRGLGGEGLASAPPRSPGPSGTALLEYGRDLSATARPATAIPSRSPAAPAEEDSPAGLSTAMPQPPETITGFTMPLQGACLPTDDLLMPNAPREYRYGWHEGIDFYPDRACAHVAEGAPVLAAKAGIVVRAKHDYQDLTGEQWSIILARSAQSGATCEEDLDVLRGRQVWIDHGDGTVTRYCHLSGIPAEVQPGTSVEAGQVVGYVGNSGTPESISNPTGQMHLHFELRVGSSFLGAGAPANDVRALYELAFAP